MRGRKPNIKASEIEAATPGFPVAPDWLPVGAAEVWNRVAEEMGGQAISGLDVDVLAAYCTDVALYHAATAMVEKDGLLTISPKGYPIQNPYLNIRNKAHARIVKAASELGLTPLSRTRLAAKAQPESSGLQALKLA